MGRYFVVIGKKIVDGDSWSDTKQDVLVWY